MIMAVIEIARIIEELFRQIVNLLIERHVQLPESIPLLKQFSSSVVQRFLLHEWLNGCFVL